MTSSAPPVIAFELGVGEFRIVTPEAIYQIKVCRSLVDASGEGPFEDEAPVPEAADGQSVFFKEISEELFDKIGRLARRLSVSVEELPSHLDMPDFDQADQQLESAKGQLEEVVKLTEKASMTIMDTADQIQVDMDQLKEQLDILRNLDMMTASPDHPAAGEVEAYSSAAMPPPANPAFFDKLQELKNIVEAWLAEQAPAEADQEPEPAQPAENSPAEESRAQPLEKVTVVRFDVDVVFQTLYELCTNESVKDHIKMMRAAQSAEFNAEAVIDRLSELAPTVDEEDGFYSFPIPEVLKTLYAATASEEYRTILKKMNQTASGIFLDGFLPIEGEQLEVEQAVKTLEADSSEAEEAAPAGTGETGEPGRLTADIPLEQLKSLKLLAQEIETVARAGFQARASEAPAADLAESEPAKAAPAALYTPILTQDRDNIIKAVGAANELIHKTGQHLTHILETLSFQDLSGQRIMRVVSMIGELQTQLISILVAANTKLQAHQNAGLKDVGGEAEKMAQQEVDKALEKLAGGSPLKGPGAETRLDQGAVNDLLAQLGF